MQPGTHLMRQRVIVWINQGLKIFHCRSEINEGSIGTNSVYLSFDLDAGLQKSRIQKQA